MASYSEAILAKAAQALKEWETAGATLAASRARQEAARKMYQDCETAAQLLDVELPRWLPAQVSRGATLTAFVQSALHEAWPGPVRVKDLQQRAIAAGFTSHEKSIGVTLYRMKRKGRVQRAGRDWTFIPQPET